MPFFQAMATRANRALGSRDNAFDADLLAPGRDLVDAFRQAGIIEHDAEAQYLRDFPGGMTEAVRALLYHNASAEPPLPVTFAWAPGYDDELTIWEVADTDRSEGGITVLVRSRFPADRPSRAAS